METVEVPDAPNTVGKRPYTRSTFPEPGSSLADWLSKLVFGKVYTTADLAEISGATLSTIRTVFHRKQVPEEAQPQKYDERGARLWSYTRAQAFLRWLAQHAHLPDAFDEPMLTAEQAAAALNVTYHHFTRGARVGNYPAPAKPSRGTVGALWKASEIEALVEQRDEESDDADE